jgi:hypothetical protein
VKCYFIGQRQVIPGNLVEKSIVFARGMPVAAGGPNEKRKAINFIWLIIFISFFFLFTLSGSHFVVFPFPRLSGRGIFSFAVPRAGRSSFVLSDVQL